MAARGGPESRPTPQTGRLFCPPKATFGPPDLAGQVERQEGQAPVRVCITPTRSSSQSRPLRPGAAPLAGLRAQLDSPGTLWRSTPASQPAGQSDASGWPEVAANDVRTGSGRWAARQAGRQPAGRQPASIIHTQRGDNYLGGAHLAHQWKPLICGQLNCFPRAVGWILKRRQ